MSASAAVPTAPGFARRIAGTRIGDAARRRIFAARMRHIETTASVPVVRVGTDYGGWHVPPDRIGPDWTCYSFGAGSDVSFDLGLIRRFGARVRGFDPFFVFREQAERAAGGDPRYSFHEVALAADDGPVEMYGRQDGEVGSVSAVNLYGVDEVHVRPGRSLGSLMDELGDRRVDLLKLDIEGSEYGVLESVDLVEAGVRVLCVELHHNRSAREAKALLGRLHRQGFRVVHRSGAADLTLERA